MWLRLARAVRLDPCQRDEVLAANPVRRSAAVRLPGLGQLRRDRGMTQRALSAALGMGTTAVRRWEHGQVNVPVGRLDDVAGSLGVDRATLLDLGAQPPRDRAVQRPLAELRRAAGPTQRELALHLGVTVRTVAHWEAGTRPLPRETARQVARVLRRPLSHILAAAGLPRARVPALHTWRPVDLPLVVAALRRSSGWSASGLGRRIGVPGWTVRGWETGTRLPSPSACERLELAYGLPRNSLSRLRRELAAPGAQHSATPWPIQAGGAVTDPGLSRSVQPSRLFAPEEHGHRHR